MVFQVNGTTILDMNQTFATSVFPTTVNGKSVLGTGDMGYVRPGEISFEVGDYLVASHSGMNSTHTYATFDANTTHAGSGLLWYDTGEAFKGGVNGTWGSGNDKVATDAYVVNSTQTGHTAMSTIAGTWRVVVRGMWDTSLSNKMPAFWARIS
tara:strand:+ start:2807 stop:3265 length:459 start_codon:yes stop_codon:yes gene_type:complete